MKEYLLGIDIGTSACKVALFHKSGEVIQSSFSEYKVYHAGNGAAQQDPNDWWNGVCDAINKLFSQSRVPMSEIAGIGVDGQSWACVLMDESGKSMNQTPIWMDTRSVDICDEINQNMEDELFELSGNVLRPGYTTGKILWYKKNEPEIYKKIKCVLQCNSYIVYRLTGVYSQDKSQGYGLSCYDMRKNEWNGAAAEKLGFSADILPSIYDCHAVVGEVTKSASEQTGLPVGIPVVAGGLDAACGTLGVGVIHATETQEQGGQAGGMSICMDTYAADKRLILGSHVVAGKWLLQGGTVGGGGVMGWMEREFAGEEKRNEAKTGISAMKQMDSMADSVVPGCDGLLFLPYMSGERSPIWNPKAKGIYYGIDFAKTRAHFFRAGMEGVAYALRHNLEVAKKAGANVETMRSMGGAANSRVWTQMKADITGTRIVVPSSNTATTLGAAILAGIGTGVYKSFEEAIQMTVHVRQIYEPQKKYKEIYDRQYEKYLKLYESTKSLMNESM